MTRWEERQALHAFVTPLAPLLSGAMVPLNPDRFWIDMDLETGGSLQFRADKGRLEIAGVRPEGYRGSMPYVFITVSMERSIAAIASEVKRRLLPAYLKSFDAARADMARHAGRVASQQAFMSCLEDAGCKRYAYQPDRADFRCGCDLLDFAVPETDLVSLSGYVSRALALRLVEVVKEFHKVGEEEGVTCGG